ncbi:MAG: hypothetical protein ACQEQV_07175, partial [Fibrobacterota bacterium]
MRSKLFLSLILISAFRLWAVPPRVGDGQYSRREASRLLQQGGALRSNTAPKDIQIYALLVEFKSDSVPNTTGTGLFGFRTDSLRRTLQDDQELAWYRESDTVYPFDRLPHNGSYFENQLRFVKNYYEKVSRGNLNVHTQLFPAQKNSSAQYPDAYQVPLEMARYSPGSSRPGEKETDFLIRRTTSLMRFVKDAVITADTSSLGSPFSSLEMDEDGRLWDIDSTGDSLQTVILIFHAGSNYLTDGGGNSLNADSPSDMSDIFVSNDFFTDYYDPAEDTVFQGTVDSTGGYTG